MDNRLVRSIAMVSILLAGCSRKQTAPITNPLAALSDEDFAALVMNDVLPPAPDAVSAAQEAIAEFYAAPGIARKKPSQSAFYTSYREGKEQIVTLEFRGNTPKTEFEWVMMTFEPATNLYTIELNKAPWEQDSVNHKENYRRQEISGTAFHKAATKEMQQLLPLANVMESAAEAHKI